MCASMAGSVGVALTFNIVLSAGELPLLVSVAKQGGRLSAMPLAYIQPKYPAPGTNYVERA